ncbi:MAG: hypothetical protein PVF70_09785 [Anaerolineales bacterium]
MPFFPRRPRPLRRARRILRRPVPVPPAARRALKRLNRAHQLMAQGEYAQAAIIYEELAESAERQAVRRSPQLNLQAGMAWLKAGEKERALARLRQGLLQMLRLGQTQRFQAAAHRILTELRNYGMAEQAQALEAELKRELSGLGLTLTAPASKPGRPHLPAKCPSCGGNVRRDEVEWLDAGTAVCDYCGSTLETSQ